MSGMGMLGVLVWALGLFWVLAGVGETFFVVLAKLGIRFNQFRSILGDFVGF